ncbi:MAG: hypothetical protein EOP24_00790 [Hyphomicrobiales bacterium]|nr:MAG: hypothetical protein EOP24_00790 [Hyphomicrobiales bacterium]
MLVASDVVPTPKPDLYLLEDAVKALLWTMPKADFSIYIDPQGGGATVTDAEGRDHLGDVCHPQPVAEAVRAAMMPAFNAQTAPGWASRERVEPGELERAFGQVLTWLPDHVLHIGRTGNHVWAEATLLTDHRESTRVQLGAERGSLAEALMGVAALLMLDFSHWRPSPSVSAPEVREAA